MNPFLLLLLFICSLFLVITIGSTIARAWKSLPFAVALVYAIISAFFELILLDALNLVNFHWN